MLVTITQRTTGAIKKAVSCLDGIIYLVGAGVVVYFPKTEADQRHAVAAIELNFGGSHACVSSQWCGVSRSQMCRIAGHRYRKQWALGE